MATVDTLRIVDPATATGATSRSRSSAKVSWPSELAIHPLDRSGSKAQFPEGAGLSSSAALEVATALALLQGRELDRLEIARLCQRAESNFVGMPCGIMDQYVSLFGHEHAALKIDCRSLESESVPLPDNVAIIAVNSMVKHNLGQSAYRTSVA